MATIVTNPGMHTTSVNSHLSWYDRLIQRLEFSYFGLIALTISIGSIIGGITAMYIFENHAPIWELALCMVGAMANNVSAIGQAPTRWVANIFIANCIICTLLVLINVI